MRAIKSELLSLMLLGCLLVPSLPAAAAPVKHIPDYFPLREGDWWKYRWTSNGKSQEFTLKVVKKDDDLYEVETTSPTQVIDDWYGKPPGWVENHKEEYPKNSMKADFVPVKQYLKNPMAVGDSWQWKGTGMMGVAIEEQSTVSANAAVTVPAGKFSALQVDTQVKQGGSDVSKSYFFTDGIGMVKSETESGGIKSTTELIDYSFKKK